MVSVVSVALMEAERSAENHLTTGSALQAPIYKISDDYLTIMPKLRSTYDGHLMYKTCHTKGARLFLGTIHLQSHKIV